MNKICVYAICKNEEKFVDKWLTSMSEADYIVVLDTGSTDGTFEKLKSDKRVTKVKQKIFENWRFDTARNESMKLIPKDANICVCTDLDEAFSEGWAQILRDSWKEDTNRAFYPYAWSHNSSGEPTDIFMYDKIHGRDNYKWTYPVHEVLVKTDDEPQVSITLENITLHHYQDLQKPRKYYFDLLQVAIEENPDDPHILELYAREFLGLGNYDLAKEWFEKTLQAKDIDTLQYKREKLYAILQLAKIAANKNDFATTSKYAMMFIANDKTYIEPYYILAEVYNEYGFFTAALGLLEDASKITYQHFDWVEDSNSYTERSDDILSIIYYGLKDIDNAIYYCERALNHVPDDLRILRNYSAFLKEKIVMLEKQTQEQNQETVPEMIEFVDEQ